MSAEPTATANRLKELSVHTGQRLHVYRDVLSKTLTQVAHTLLRARSEIPSQAPGLPPRRGEHSNPFTCKAYTRS